MSAVGFGDDDAAACVFVEPMNNAGPEGRADTGESAAVMQERGDESAGGVSRARVDDDPTVLVDDEKLLVLVENLDGDGFGLNGGGLGLREGDLNGVAGSEGLLWFGGRAVEEDVTIPNEGLEAGTRTIRELASQVAVETGSGAVLL